MDQSTSAQSLSGATGARRADRNGLAPHVAAVEAARARLGRDLDTLDTEVRAQMGHTAEKTAWKVLGTGGAIIAGIMTRKVLMATWRKTKHSDPPTNPADRETDWVEALTWTVATSIAVGIARLIATRGAAGAWEKFTGALPPGLQDVSP
ncbi:MAG: DUF4235 domain-containing protein [Actinomycetota bacterium]|nr:DUF4235 domain-containing protein [Actinomycetota bacterium]